MEMVSDQQTRIEIVTALLAPGYSGLQGSIKTSISFPVDVSPLRVCTRLTDAMQSRTYIPHPVRDATTPVLMATNHKGPTYIVIRIDYIIYF